MKGAFRLRFVLRGEIGGDGAQASDGFAWGAARRDVGEVTAARQGEVHSVAGVIFEEDSGELLRGSHRDATVARQVRACDATVG
ncbi:MAG: hypothetical protein A3H25_18180 [Sphingomonadales bacterium RIFCSPLOWO2_12_FULL_63_15]|nr:MAG: hypothetical protein A3H25_18180 [Sphingomonadales bacterium RIFCSPLOWO2_12_FULL_63_15]